MKTIFKFLLVFGFFSFFAQNAKAADTLNPCWRLLYPHDPEHLSFNPDSVMIDTCATTDPVFPVLYAYKWYNIFLPYGALNVPWAPRDSLIYRNWRDIDSSFTELRDAFQMIENKFSTFIMRKQYPDLTDTFGIASTSYFIKFEKYFIIDSVVYYLKLINDLYDAFYDMRAFVLADNVYDTKYEKNLIIIKIFPIPSNGNIIVEISNNKYDLQFIEIYNEINQLVYQYSLIKLNENIMIKIDLSFLQHGIYFLKNGYNIKKFIISK